MAQNQQYDLQNRVEIGRGVFGRVFKVKDLINNTFVAVKSISNFLSTKNEVKLLQGCISPFIVQFIGVLEHDFSTLIIMEYCSKGSLMNILKNRSAMNEKEINQIMKHILMGLNYLHTKNILHRDIKPDNILLGNDSNYKLSDFGVSKNVQTSTAKTKVGTPLYMAPELLMFKKYDNKCDVYSVGITAIHLFIYTDPEIIKDIPTIRKIIADINQIQTNNENFKRFIAKCIAKNSINRSNVDQLLNSDPFITNNNMNEEKSCNVASVDQPCSVCNGNKQIKQKESSIVNEACSRCGGQGGTRGKWVTATVTCNGTYGQCNGGYYYCMGCPDRCGWKGPGTCAWCPGYKKRYTCSDCNGKGTIQKQQFNNNHWNACSQCSGKGTIPQNRITEKLVPCTACN